MSIITEIMSTVDVEGLVKSLANKTAGLNVTTNTNNRWVLSGVPKNDTLHSGTKEKGRSSCDRKVGGRRG